MLSRSFALLAAATFAALGAGGGPALAQADPAAGQRISEPHMHRNLAVYLIHGVSATDAVPLTLAEALDKKKVQVTETGVVNELRVENTGDEAVFIQAG